MCARIGLLLLMSAAVGCNESSVNDIATFSTEVPNEIFDKSQLNIVGRSKLVVHSNKKLAAPQRKGFEEFRSRLDDGFAAFYVTPGGSGWTSNFGMISEDDAKKTTSAFCDGMHGKRCVLYATLVPEEVANRHSLPQAVTGIVKDAVEKTQSGNFIAISTNVSGRVGTSFNYDNIQDAVKDAIVQCENNVREYQAENISVAYFLERKGYFECELFGVYQ